MSVQVNLMDMPPQLGRYRLLRELGRGAMGVIYAGLDISNGAQVAIKTLAPTSAATQNHARHVKQLRHEALVLQLLAHPHIVRVHDYGEQDGIAYVAMERLSGETLKSRLDREMVPIDQALRITAQLLDALAHAHQCGVVHRDVKPANLIIDVSGWITLTDFGVARCGDTPDEDDNPAALLIGTPSYMSPEQISGQAVGPQADLFATGIVFYQLLTRQRPFTGSGHWAVQRHILHRHPVPPSMHNVQLSVDIDAVVFRALAKHPGDRYADAREFLQDLERVRAVQAVPAHVPTLRALAEAREKHLVLTAEEAFADGQESDFWRSVEATPPPDDLAQYLAGFPQADEVPEPRSPRQFNDRDPETDIAVAPSERVDAHTVRAGTNTDLAVTPRSRRWHWLPTVFGCALVLLLVLLLSR